MEEVNRKDFSCDKDFNRVNDFLSSTYNCEGIHNWDNARWSFNRYCAHNQEELNSNRTWEKSARLWENAEGEIIAAAHIEEPGNYFFQVHPKFKFLEEEMLLWAIDDCRKRYSNLNKIVVTSCHNDYERKKLYDKYGAVKLEFIDEHRVVELKNKYSLPKLPEGYKIINLESQDLEACKKISDLYTYIWPSSTYMPNGETVASMTKSIAYRKDLSFIVVDDNDMFAAFTIAWVDSINKIAHFYPIAVGPNYLNTNILECMLKNALNTLIALGYEKATIGAWYREEEEQAFENVGFEKNDWEEIYDIKF